MERLRKSKIQYAIAICLLAFSCVALREGFGGALFRNLGSIDLVRGLARESYTHKNARFGRAEQAFRTALEWTPSQPSTHRQLGSLFNALNEVEAALEEWKESDNPVAWLIVQGNSDEQHGRLESARAKYEYAHDLDPGSSEPLYFLGRISEEMARSQEAVEYYRRAVIQNSYDYGFVNLLQSQFKIGVVLFAQRELKAAEEEFWKCLEIDPRFAPPYIRLGQIYVWYGDMERAQSLLISSIELGANSVYPYLILGGAYGGKGNTAQACFWLEQGLQRFPHNARIMDELAKFCIAESEWNDKE